MLWPAVLWQCHVICLEGQKSLVGILSVQQEPALCRCERLLRVFYTSYNKGTEEWFVLFVSFFEFNFISCSFNVTLMSIFR